MCVAAVISLTNGGDATTFEITQPGKHMSSPNALSK
jgi:hypothetical protein